MKRGFKVFGATTRNRKGKWVRTIIGTKTKKEAARVLGIPLWRLNDFWCVTGNAAEISIASQYPGEVLEEEGTGFVKQNTEAE
jgi:hypothetical protein